MCEQLGAIIRKTHRYIFATLGAQKIFHFFLQKSILCMPCNYLLLSIATAVATNHDLEKKGNEDFISDGKISLVRLTYDPLMKS